VLVGKGEEGEQKSLKITLINLLYPVVVAVAVE
jgi:hypothetical protein